MLNDAELKLAIEQHMDKNGAAGTLELFEEICFEKADHVRLYWQDEALGKLWDKVATRVGLAIVAARNLP